MNAPGDCEIFEEHQIVGNGQVPGQAPKNGGPEGLLRRSGSDYCLTRVQAAEVRQDFRPAALLSRATV
jgi:hypothetical protein